MERKKRFSILKLLVIILCIVSIILSAGINILFSGKNVPSLFGRVIYVVDENNPMEGDITTGSALIAMEAEGISIATGDIILCYPADNPETICLRSVNYIIQAEDGTERYFTRDSFHKDDTDAIPKDKIIAVCTGYPESPELGQFITFAKDIKGILLLLVATSVILVIFIISAIVNAHSGSDEEDEVNFYEYEENKKGKGKKSSKSKKNDPLFEPDSEALQNPELELKKMSIAENFSQKHVNPNSPYQKEKERTMQFKAQRGNIPNNTATFSNPKYSDSQQLSVAADYSRREEMLRKTAEAERTGIYNITGNAHKASETVTDNTGILSKSQVAQLSRGDVTVNRNVSASVSNPAKPVIQKSVSPQKSNTPDISDIISKTSSPHRKKNPSDMSVDDLLQMIEDERKKL